MDFREAKKGMKKGRKLPKFALIKYYCLPSVHRLLVFCAPFLVPVLFAVQAIWQLLGQFINFPLFIHPLPPDS
jgi:hypothetical protein